MVQGVMQTFRRRLSPEQANAFANVLPICLRALFVTDWDPRQPARPFVGRQSLISEVKALRGEHNFSPDAAIVDVARALRKQVDSEALDRVLTELPPGSIEFWAVD